MLATGQADRPYESKPELYGDLAPIWDAFQALHPTRPVAMGAGPIPRSEVRAYFGIMGIADPEDRVFYLRMIRALDDAWLAWHAKRREAEVRRPGA